MDVVLNDGPAAGSAFNTDAYAWPPPEEGSAGGVEEDQERETQREEGVEGVQMRTLRRLAFDLAGEEEGGAMREGRPVILDGFCKAGGAGMGYHRAGFRVVGVDVEPQPRYPFEFHRADFFEFVAEHGREFDAIHASPPCKSYTQMQHLARLSRKIEPGPGLIPECRAVLTGMGKPYVIENVPGARRELCSPILLCGSAFGLDVRQHRYFESNVLLHGLWCAHHLQEKRFPPTGPTRTGVMRVITVTGGGTMQRGITLAQKRLAMGIDWMTGDELGNAIPPAYTEHIGAQLLWHLEGGK